MQTLLVSLACVALTGVICRVARILVNSLVQDEFHKVLAFEVVTTFELCASVFEIGIIVETYGILVYGCVMLVVLNYWMSTWGSAAANPCPHILNLVLGKADLSSVVMKIVAQIFGGCIVYTFYTKHVWGLGLQDVHVEKLATASQCQTTLQVTPFQGIFIEAACIFAFLTLCQLFGGTKYGFIVMPMALVSVVFSGMHFTGAWFNPVLASTLQFGCSGINPLDHFLVFWIGPILGTIVNHYTFELLKKSKILKLD